MQGLFIRKEPRHLPQGISGELSSSLSIFELGWCLKLRIGVLRLKMTLELPFGISTRECSRDEQFKVLTLVLVVLIVLVLIKDLMRPFYRGH